MGKGRYSFLVHSFLYYKGIPAYRASLTTRGNGKLDDYFILRDTLLTYNSKQMEPLYFRKGAREGKRYTVDEIFYTYPNGKCSYASTESITRENINGWRIPTMIVVSI